MQEEPTDVTGGVDTHSQVHVAAIVNMIGTYRNTIIRPNQSRSPQLTARE